MQPPFIRATEDCAVFRREFYKVSDSGGTHTANSIAYWGADNLWHALGAGLNAGVYTLAVSAGGTVYVGGQFTQSGGALTTSRLAAWNGSTWAAVSAGNFTEGTDANVHALFANGTSLYAGGSFMTAGDSVVRGIGRYDTTAGVWSGLGSSVNGTVSAVAVSWTDVYLGGSFTSVDGLATPGIAHLQTATGTWSMLGTGGLAGCTWSLFICSPTVNAILVTPTDVYITGNFGSVSGVTANGVARWNKSDLTWHALGTGLGCSSFLCSFFGSALAFNPASGQLFVGGNFTSAGGVAAANLAKWSLGGGWSTVGAALPSSPFNTWGSWHNYLPITVRQ